MLSVANKQTPWVCNKKDILKTIVKRKNIWYKIEQRISKKKLAVTKDN